jgi:uncharacterized protein (DUF58 family)
MLPSEIVKQVRRIQLHTGRQVADVLAGAYVSVFKGRGVEFDEVRPYVPGDDVRTIDWNVTARVGTPYVKRYVEERQLTVLLLVDMSASQDFGSAARSKREAAAELSALLAFSAIYNDDKIGLLLFHSEVDEYIPPRKGQKHALRVVREVLARGHEDQVVDRGQKRQRTLMSLPRAIANQFRRLIDRTKGGHRRSTDIAHALEFCRRVLPRRAVLFLISDFLDEGYLDVLRSANRKHDVVAVRITDQRETGIENTGLLTLEDAETGERHLVDTQSDEFRMALEAHARARTDALNRDLRSAGIDVVTIDAARSVVDPLLAFFRMREKRIRR